MTRNYLEEIALEILEQTRGDHADPFGLATARLFSISAIHNRRILLEMADVYAGISAIPCMHTAIGEDAMVAIEACGYAAPAVDVDAAPSMHPARRRVRLIVIANRDGDLGSALEFSDEPGKPITTSTGQGSLADELAKAMRRLELIQSLPLNNPTIG